MSEGLDGIAIADTVISHVDSTAGKLWVRGVELPILATDYGFEGVAALLWEGFAGQGHSRGSLQRLLGLARTEAFAQLNISAPGLSSLQPEAAVKRTLASLADNSPAAMIVGALTVVVPAVVRAAGGMPPVAPDPTLPTASDVLRMLHGLTPDPSASAALDVYLTVMAESGVGPSTFAARVIASTRASLVNAVLGAFCAFTGPLHGGAPGPTLDLLDTLEAADDIDALIELKLRAGERLMGFGHRMFHGNDPRADALRKALRHTGAAAKRLALIERVEAHVAAAVDRVKPGRLLPVNVEVMAASLLDSIGIPRAAFTALFAVARTVGWITHALEQQQTGRMFRPTSRYVGPRLDEQKAIVE